MNVDNFITNIIQPPKWFERTKEMYSEMNRVFSVFAGCDAYRGAISSIAAIQQIPQEQLMWLSGIQFIRGMGFIFRVPDLIKNIYKSVNSTDIGDRIEHIANSVLGVAGITASFSSLYSVLSNLKVISLNAAPVFNNLHLILLPIQVLAVERDITNTNKASKVLTVVKSGIKCGKKTDVREKRIELLTESCYFVSKNFKNFRKELKISKHAQIDSRIDNIRARLSSENADEKNQALEEGESLMKMLKQRARVNFGLEMNATIAKITGIVASIVLLACIVPMSSGWTVVGGVTALALTFFGLKKLLLNKNPLSQPKDVWHEKAIHQLRQRIYDAIENVRQQSKKLSQAVLQHLPQFALAA